MKKKKLSEVEKREKCKSTTWDYFWEAKLKEFLWLIIILAIVGVMIVLPIQLGEFMIDNEIIFKQGYCDYVNGGIENYDGNCTQIDLWFAGFVTLFVLFMVGLISYLFIKANWMYAKGKAEEDVYGY